MIPFSVNFLELVLEVAKHTNIASWVIKDAKGNIILYLTKEGIEKAIGWSNRVVIFTQKYTSQKYEEYNNKHRPNDFIQSLLKPKNHGLAHQAVMKAQICLFHDIASKYIHFLCRIIGKSMDIHFEKDLFSFIYKVNKGESIRWS